MDRNKISFGRFGLDVNERQLARDGVIVPLGSRAVDILCVLAAAKGEVVSKDELMTRVWPGLVVEENNIQVHVSALRKALDEGKSGQTQHCDRARTRLPVGWSQVLGFRFKK